MNVYIYFNSMILWIELNRIVIVEKCVRCTLALNRILHPHHVNSAHLHMQRIETLYKILCEFSQSLGIPCGSKADALTQHSYVRIINKQP